MKIHYIYIKLFLCFFIFSNLAEARWGTQKDVAVVYNFIRDLYQVEKDGTYVLEQEFKAKVVKSSGIDGFTSFRLYYNGQSEKLEILFAKTINDGKEFPVNSKFIQDKPLASSHQGFDQTHQVLIAFPHVQVGSYIHIKYRVHVKIASYQNFFSYFGMHNPGAFIIKSETKIESALPLFYKINNPKRLLKISYKVHNRKNRKYVFTSRFRRPFTAAIVDEKYWFPERDLFPWVEITTTREWSEMVKDLVPEYEKVIAAPLPELHMKILKSAKKIKNGPKDQIDFIISSLIEKIRYLGDWRPIRGGHVPRPLSVIAKTGFGDCKDLSVSLVSILRGIGFKAQVGLVFRNWFLYGYENFKLPNGHAFNHAIVRAEMGNKVFWLDPTNIVSYSRGLFNDIADKPVLILQEPKSKMDRIPQLHKEGAEINITQNFSITKKGLTKVKGDIYFKNRSAVPFTGGSLYKSKESLDYLFIEFSGVDTSILNLWKVSGYDLKSRIVKDFSVQMDYSLEKGQGPFGYWTQLGPVFRLPFPGDISVLWNRLFYIKTRDRISGLGLGQPRRLVLTSKLKDIKSVGDLNINCNPKSRWADFSRKVESVKPLVIKDIYELKSPYITAKELKSSEFLRFQKSIRHCFEQFLIVYKKGN